MDESGGEELGGTSSGGEEMDVLFGYIQEVMLGVEIWHESVRENVRIGAFCRSFANANELA